MIHARFLISERSFLYIYCIGRTMVTRVYSTFFFSSLTYSFTFAAFNWYWYWFNVLVLILFCVYIAFQAILGLNIWTGCWILTFRLRILEPLINAPPRLRMNVGDF